MKQKKGFTLIEITVCILILGLLVSLVSLIITTTNKHNRNIESAEKALVISDEIFAYFKNFQKSAETDFSLYLKTNDKYQNLENDEIIIEGYKVIIKCEKNENNDIYNLNVNISKDNSLFSNRTLSLLKVVAP